MSESKKDETTESDLELPPPPRNPHSAPMVTVAGQVDRQAPGYGSVGMPRLTAADFKLGDGYQSYLAELERHFPEWFDEFAQVSAFDVESKEMIEIMTRAPAPFLAGMVYGQLVQHKRTAAGMRQLPNH